MRRLGKFTLVHGVAVSLLLHACLAVSFYGAVNWRWPRKPGHPPSRLNLELFGMLSNRQVEAQQRRVEAVRRGSAAPRAEDNRKDKTQTAPKEMPGQPAPIPLEESPADLPDAVKLPAFPASLANALSSFGSQPRAGGDFQQRQQFLGPRNGADDRLSAYLAELTKRVRANLLYPLEAKKKRIEGVSLISFVVAESGEIEPGTLAVKKSSGYAALDASALKSAQASAPFPKPPRELSVAIAVSFDVD